MLLVATLLLLKCYLFKVDFCLLFWSVDKLPKTEKENDAIKEEGIKDRCVGITPRINVSWE